MNKNYPIYKTTFIDDMRSLVEEAAQNFPDSIAISYKDKPSDKEVKKVTFMQWKDDVRNLGTALIANGLREENIAIIGENSYGWCCSFFAVMAIGSVTVPVDKELPIEDIDGIISTTGCKAVIFGKTAENKRPSHPTKSNRLYDPVCQQRWIICIHFTVLKDEIKRKGRRNDCGNRLLGCGYSRYRPEKDHENDARSLQRP